MACFTRIIQFFRDRAYTRRLRKIEAVLLELEFKELLMTKKSFRTMKVLSVLGRGSYGKVELVEYQGEKLVLKTMHHRSDFDVLGDEARNQLRLAGAGGAPLVKGISIKKPRMLMTCAGSGYDEYINDFSDWDFIDSFIKIGRRLQEIHDRGIIHNDLKFDNITVNVTEEGRQYNIIDYGMSSLSGEVSRIGDPDNNPSDYKWMAPEMMLGEPTEPSCDVYSFGQLIIDVGKSIVDPHVKESVFKIARQASRIAPEQRATLSSVLEDLELIKGKANTENVPQSTAKDTKFSYSTDTHERRKKNVFKRAWKRFRGFFLRKKSC